LTDLQATRQKCIAADCGAIENTDNFRWSRAFDVSGLFRQFVKQPVGVLHFFVPGVFNRAAGAAHGIGPVRVKLRHRRMSPTRRLCPRERTRPQRVLPAIRAFDKALHPTPPQIAQEPYRENHIDQRVFTQPGSTMAVRASSVDRPVCPPLRTPTGLPRTAGLGRFCCKSRFALVIKNSAGCRRGFRVKM